MYKNSVIGGKDVPVLTAGFLIMRFSNGKLQQK
jgi:hypothetical protein